MFAIAATLLVLELAVHGDASAHLLRSILHEWPALLAFVTSFLTIGVIWLQHSAITGTLRTADATLYRLNLVVLPLTSFLPFPTRLVSQYVGEREPERVAVVFHGVTLLALAIAPTVFVRYAAEHRRLVADQAEADAVEAALVHQPSFRLSPVGIAIAVFLPTVGVAFHLGIALDLGVPARTLRRLLRTNGAPVTPAAGPPS